MLKHDLAIRIENYTGQPVEEAGIFYTKPLLLQHQRHFSKEIFEVTPMEPEVDIFLPYWWISKHLPQGVWEWEEIRFNSPGCQETCTRYEQGEFSLTWDEKVAHDPNARVIGHISAVTTDDTLAVTLENHGQVRTLREVRTKEERYVPAASYSQPRDLRESRREIRRG